MFQLRGSTLALPATPLPFGFSSVPLLDIDVAFERLPAETRARFLWAKQPIAAGIARLVTEPLADALVAEVADQALRPFLTLGRAFAELVAANQDEWRARFVDDFQEEERQLSTFVESADSQDTLQWILGFLQSFTAMALSFLPDAVRAVDDTAVEALSVEEEFKPYMRGLVALMAATETRRRGGDAQRARDLLDVAFLQLHTFRAELRRQGISLSPFPRETVEERRHKLLESAGRLREALSTEDWRTIDQAHLRDLR